MNSASHAVDSARQRFTQRRIDHWNGIAATQDRWTWNRAYHRRVAEVYRALIPEGESVLEVGCGQGDLLAAVRARRAVGVDASERMLRRARARHPEIAVVHGDAHDLPLRGGFDYVILSDLITDVWDAQQVLAAARRVTTTAGRVILNFYSHLWGAPLAAAQGLGLASPRLEQSWLTLADVRNLLRLAGLHLVHHRVEVLWPFRTPWVEPFVNRVLVKLWPFWIGALTHVIVARPAGIERRGAHRVSVVVPARNEAGNIDELIRRVPQMGAGTELLFVEGHSRDGTFDAIERAIAAHPTKNCAVFRQSGKGKGDAVRLGFEHAGGDVLMILDADMTVAPEDLPKFLEALESGSGEFVNGVRLVYPMDDKAMRLANLVANKAFSWLFTWLLGQPIRDTLCGTKALWSHDYRRIARDRGYFGDFDPFGDFDLLFGAARLSRHIVEMPIRYRNRVYGETQIRRWRDGLFLLRMSLVAARKLKWV
jgi:ubiquinone/menaquinone biosynthesis C-methylase UbiE